MSSIKKLKPLRPSCSRSDVYVTREQRKYVGQFKRVRKLLVDRHYLSVTVHGLGAAIPHAIKLANSIKASLGDQLTMDVSTDTVTLYDEVTNPEGEITCQARQNTAVHIKMSLPGEVKKLIDGSQK